MMDFKIDLPYEVEYAKSASNCTECKKQIEIDELRLAHLVPSMEFDGNVANWYHFECFFKCNHPESIVQIKDFEHLRFSDQRRIEEELETLISYFKDGKNNCSSTGKRKLEPETNNLKTTIWSYLVEYSKSNRAFCLICKTNITDSIRIGKREGGNIRWLHIECLISKRDFLGFSWPAECLPRFDSLKKEDQEFLLKKFSSIDVITPKPRKQIKIITDQDEELSKQSDLIFKYFDGLKNMKTNEIEQFFIENEITKIPNNEHVKKQFLADALAFGLPEQCPKCNGTLLFKVKSYVCNENISEWERCRYSTDKPNRRQVKIPKNLQCNYPFLMDYKYEPKTRIVHQELKERFEQRQKSLTRKELAKVVIREEKDDDKPLADYSVALLGASVTKEEVEKLGAKCETHFSSKLLCILSKDDFFEKSKLKNTIRNLKIPVVSENFLEKVSKFSKLTKALMSCQVEFWGLTEDDIEQRISRIIKEKNDSVFCTLKSGVKPGAKIEKSIKLLCKDGVVVDPSSGLADFAHVLKDNGDVYHAVLNFVELETNKNSFYKLQLLQHDMLSQEFYVFESWGRIGEVGRKLVNTYHVRNTAIEKFKSIFFEKTQNQWDERGQFVRKPSHYFPVEMGSKGDSKSLSLSKLEDSLSKLPMPVKELISMLFDVQHMKRTMLEFEVDLEKLPLGMLSKKHILEACSLLQKILILLPDLEKDSRMVIQQVTDLCTKFYSLIPHNSGQERPPLILTEEMIDKKNKMLESMLEIATAYELMQEQSKDTKDLDSYDSHYKKLKADIEPLDKTDPVFKLIQKYLQNTHAKTHLYKLEILDVFKITRHGEAERFKKFADNPNRMLLWHGSRTTNFAGIISQGLRIAPKEAPTTGYMFGKGIYFADSVSKSANYCYPDSTSSIGLLALSEVALGNSMELTEARYITKPAKGFMSVKGIGMSQPDESETVVIENGIKVPLGNLKESYVIRSQLLYNEYIVYDEAQVKIRYLVRAKFKSRLDIW